LSCLLGLFVLLGCSRGQPTPTIDVSSIEATVAGRIFATLTAQAVLAHPETPAEAREDIEATVVSRVLATLTADAVSVQSRTPEAKETPTPTNTPAPPTPTVIPSPVPSPTSPELMAIVQAEVLNVRSGPGTNYPVIASVKQGDSLQVMARNQDANWIEIMLSSGRRGWVAVWLVQHGFAIEAVPLASVIPTPPPTPSPTPTEVHKELQVTFINMHYECQRRIWEFEAKKGIVERVWGYRSFQVDMYITNNSDKPVEPPWRPRRWIITDGRQEYISDLMWQWVHKRTGAYKQPPIYPGQTAGWTFMAFPLDAGQWVKAAEFEWNGQVYRQEFDLGPVGNSYNYIDCGDVLDHPYYPTPTPRP